MNAAQRKRLEDHIAKLERGEGRGQRLELEQPEPALRRGYRRVSILGMPGPSSRAQLREAGARAAKASRRLEAKREAKARTERG